MARIVGVDIPNNKRGEIALTYIFGIGRSRSNEILEKAGVDKNIKVNEWNDDQFSSIRKVITGCYRGIRHRLGLPVRGQSTKNNARTRKGKKKTVANKKKATK
jgi:small subunit ribosomal protein S13